MIFSLRLQNEAIEIVREVRKRRGCPVLHPVRVTLFALPEDNDLTNELVLKVHGKATAYKVVPKPKKDRLEGLFADDTTLNEEVRVVELGEDFSYVWGRELPGWAVAEILRGAELDRVS